MGPVDQLYERIPMRGPTGPMNGFYLRLLSMYKSEGTNEVHNLKHYLHIF